MDKGQRSRLWSREMRFLLVGFGLGVLMTAGVTGTIAYILLNPSPESHGQSQVIRLNEQYKSESVEFELKEGMKFNAVTLGPSKMSDVEGRVDFLAPNGKQIQSVTLANSKSKITYNLNDFSPGKWIARFSVPRGTLECELNWYTGMLPAKPDYFKGFGAIENTEFHDQGVF